MTRPGNPGRAKALANAEAIRKAMVEHGTGRGAISRIARDTGLDPSTVRKALARGLAVRPPGRGPGRARTLGPASNRARAVAMWKLFGATQCQARIARVLGVSQSEISRLLREAGHGTNATAKQQGNRWEDATGKPIRQSRRHGDGTPRNAPRDGPGRAAMTPDARPCRPGSTPVTNA